MRRIPVGTVTTLIGEAFTAAGCSRAEGRRIASSLVAANLAGHDSHGIVRTPRYLDMLRDGRVLADRRMEIVGDGEAMAVADGRNGFGQTIGPQAVGLGIDKARRTGVAVIALRNTGHLGRIGEWGLMAADAGFVSVHFVNARGSILVAPFGASERRFSTAPFCVAVPRKGSPALVLDFATSIVAEGKVLVAAKGGKPVPGDALIDSDGRLSGDPATLYGPAGPDAPPDMRDGTGAIRAMGEHKGSGLALMCELLGGALTGNGTCGPDEVPFANGMFSIYADHDAFGSGSRFADTVEEYVAWVLTARPADPNDPIQMPGDPERATEAERRANGLPLPDDAWNAILAAVAASGLPGERTDELLAACA